jgi:hypothetical protein
MVKIEKMKKVRPVRESYSICWRLTLSLLVFSSTIVPTLLKG